MIGEFISIGVAFSWTITALCIEYASKRIGSISVNFLRLSLAEKRKGTQCADAGSPISLNIRDPISDISKKSEIGVMNHEKMAGRTQL